MGRGRLHWKISDEHVMKKLVKNDRRFVLLMDLLITNLRLMKEKKGKEDYIYISMCSTNSSHYMSYVRTMWVSTETRTFALAAETRWFSEIFTSCGEKSFRIRVEECFRERVFEK